MTKSNFSYSQWGIGLIVWGISGQAGADPTPSVRYGRPKGLPPHIAGPLYDPVAASGSKILYVSAPIPAGVTCKAPVTK